MIWFTADTHFGHKSIVRMTDRPFETVAQMNDAFVRAINARVSATDTLYVLGDFSFRMGIGDASALRELILCRDLRLMRGNHDKHWGTSSPATFASEQDYAELCGIGRNGGKVVLCHYPIMSWNAMWHGSIHLHGHIHSQGDGYNKANRDAGILRYDVGVDANGYAPVSLDEILQFFEGVEPRPASSEPDAGHARGERSQPAPDAR